ncbi:MAG: DUF3822 family protein [Saprospiraceae bacterium]|nr:DUF3822 family protein [Saprospiraceae bacterium]
MGKIKNQVIEATYAKKDSVTQKLSILFGMDSFAYIVSSEQGMPLLIKDFELEKNNKSSLLTEFQQIMEEDRPLSLPYRKIRLAYVSGLSTMVPGRLYQEQERAQYLQQLTEIEEEYLFLADHLSPVDAQNVYAIEQSLANFIQSSYPGAPIRHINSVLYQCYYELAKSISESVFVNVRDRGLQVFYFREGQLVFTNTFEYQASRDFIYYVMLVFDQFELDNKSVPVYLSGQIVDQSEIYRLLFRYVKHVHFIERLAAYQYGAKLKEAPIHFYLDLLALANYQL